MGFKDKDEPVGENELEYRNGNNKITKIFIQKCVICFENLNVYAFSQCCCLGIFENVLKKIKVIRLY